MKKKLTIVILLFICIITAYALNKSFNFEPNNLSFATGSKQNAVLNSFNKDYTLETRVESKINDSKLEEEIISLTKKATYLLFGEAGSGNETSEQYYQRHSDWKLLRYNPVIPKDENNILGIDTNSKEYYDDLISGMASAQVFNQATELGLTYKTFGDINISINNDMIISSIVLPDVKIKEQSKTDPMKYDYVDTNFIMYYYFKKLDNEWKIYYLYGESSDDISKYVNEVQKFQKDVKAISYNSELSKIYDFSKLENLSLEESNNIYNSNIDKLVYFSSYYNNIVKAEANGFYISDNLVVTTWSFLEESLINAQVITAMDSSNKMVSIDGIVVANPDTDIVVLKVKEAKEKVLLANKKPSVEDVSITISTKNGDGFAIQSGIIINNNGYLESTIPLTKKDSGSPLFNINGEVVGMNTSKSIDTSISYAVNSDILKEIIDKFSNVKYDDIKAISFNDLKEKYYYLKKSNEKIVNSIPSKKWQEYSKIGNINETINMELVKASYQDDIVSLRYKNHLSSYIDGLRVVYKFKEQLVNDGYKLVVNTKEKMIYQNNTYKVILMSQFDYLIVVMVKL